MHGVPPFQCSLLLLARAWELQLSRCRAAYWLKALKSSCWLREEHAHAAISPPARASGDSPATTPGCSGLPLQLYSCPKLEKLGLCVWRKQLIRCFSFTATPATMPIGHCLAKHYRDAVQFCLLLDLFMVVIGLLRRAGR